MKHPYGDIDRALLVGAILLAWFTFLKWAGLL
jgi:hypothetical protein